MMPDGALTGLEPFRDASPATLAALARHAVEVRYATDEVVFLAGAEPRGWFVVLDGCVRVIRGSGDRQHVIHTEQRGGTLGEVPLFAGGVMPATAIAAEPTRCALFTREALESAIAGHPRVATILLGRLALRVRALVERLDGRSAMSVQQRLGEFLLNRMRAGSTTITLGMTQGAVAEELGTVREVVSRELRALCRSGTLEALGGGRYRVARVDALGARSSQAATPANAAYAASAVQAAARSDAGGGPKKV